MLEDVLRRDQVEALRPEREPVEVGHRTRVERRVLADRRIEVDADRARHVLAVVVRELDPSARPGIEQRRAGRQVPADEGVEAGMLVDVPRVVTVLERLDVRDAHTSSTVAAASALPAAA